MTVVSNRPTVLEPRLSHLLLGLLLILNGLGAVLCAQDLQFEIDHTTTRVRGRDSSGTRLFPMGRIASLLGLEVIGGNGPTVEVRGARGRLTLTEGRPLVRYQEDYILLSGAVRRATNGDWYVPGDLLEKGLALIVDRKLERTGNHRYRLETLKKNVVRVDLVNYPDHVAVVFSSSQETAIRVRDFRRYLKVEFEGFAVEPQITKVSPDQDLLREVRFDSLDRFGSFELIKGPEFYTYRQYTLTSPDREVVGLYGRPLSTLAERSTRSTVETLDPPGKAELNPPYPGAMGKELDAPEFHPEVDARVVTIDPGHGGDDLGVTPTPEILESQVVWEVAQQVEEFLGMNDNGFEVRLTRNKGMNPSLEQRSSQANSQESKVFVSLHLGASEVEEIRGAVVYVHRYFDRRQDEDPDWLDWNDGQREVLTQSKRLAEILQRKLNLLFGIGNQVAEAPLAVLAPVKAPAVMIELGYLSNPEDRASLLTPEFRRQVAAAIASGIKEFLK